MEAIALSDDDAKTFENLQLETTALRMTIQMQHEAVVRHTQDLASRTAAHWKNVYDKLGLPPDEPWRYENGQVIKVEPPASDGIALRSERHPGLNADMSGPRGTPLEDGSPDYP